LSEAREGRSNWRSGWTRPAGKCWWSCTRDETRSTVFDFVEGWYNHRRRHSYLGYLSPVQFERHHSNNFGYAAAQPEAPTCLRIRGNSTGALPLRSRRRPRPARNPWAASAPSR